MWYLIWCKSCLTLNILVTVKSYDELLRKVKIDHYVCKIGLRKNKIKISKKLNAIIAVRTLCARRENDVFAPCARCEHAAATACALWKRLRLCKDAVGTSCGRCRDAVRTLCDAITDTFDILGVFRGDPTARWHGFRTLHTNAVASPFGVTGA